VNLRKHTLFLNVLEAIGLIPPGRKYVERDLSTNAVRQSVVCKILLERFDKVPADVVSFVVGFVIVAFLDSVFPFARLVTREVKRRRRRRGYTKHYAQWGKR